MTLFLFLLSRSKRLGAFGSVNFLCLSRRKRLAGIGISGRVNRCTAAGKDKCKTAN